MSARPPGRRTESLFDNRYRYDYIYPRGRSGETLRAYDIQDHDRPVVIKRPAPQDAPPMRAGQEVSIRNEKQALERLSGHPVLTELRGSGTFRVGGHTHDYIVMDLAQGQIIADMVLQLAHEQCYLPELEMLVIMDGLLSLLALAHDKQVVYNDVDAKHLFWDRTAYRLKVIDWGNAVFLDEPGALPSVTRATDIYQCGELLYFLLTGGNRLDTETEEGEAFFVNFGTDAERIPAKLQAIITRAVHPDPKRRFGTILELRHVLAEYRQPLEKTRDDIVARVRKRVRATASQEELEELADGLRVALEMDPGCPDAVALAGEIEHYRKQITIQADLDAIRIYLESSNWPRALALLANLLPNANPPNEPLIRFLMAATAALEKLRIAPPPAGFMTALDSLFQGNAPAAGQILLTADEDRPAARQAQWLLAEQLAALISDVILLRPHLVRLREDLRALPGADAALILLEEIDTRLDGAPVPGLVGLHVVYQQVAELLARLEGAIEHFSDSRPAPDQESALASVIRAQRAAQDLAGHLDAVGECAFADRVRADELLLRSAMIDPTSPYLAALHDYLGEIHQAVAALGQFKPRSDGTNLAGWFADVQDFLQPYLDDLPDGQFHAAAAAIRHAAEGWTTTVNYLALGRRQPAIDALRSTAETIRPFNEQIAAWLGTVANRLPDATMTERHHPDARLADLLIEGWRAWDQGSGARAAELGRQAYEQAATDGERLAANRLRRLGELLDNWLANSGAYNAERTDQVETEALAVLLSEEEQERRTFAEQMPNTTLYLRAMSRGLVAYMHQSSSAGWRALYLHYVLRGMLALLSGELDEAEFWRTAASKTFDEAITHRVFQSLDRALTAKRLAQAAEQALNSVSGPGDLDNARRTLNAPLAGEVLAGAEQSVQAINAALRDWSDGDFSEALRSLDAALAHIQQAIENAGLQIEPFVRWVTELRDTAAELKGVRLQIEQSALSASAAPDPALAEAHRRILTTTLSTLGPDHAHQVRQWHEMYQAALETYTTQRLTRREKLAAFGRHFASLFIAKHPAYPLFRHWEAVIEQLPPDEVEDDVIVVEESLPAAKDDASLDYLEDDREPVSPARKERSHAPEGEGDLPWNWIIAGAVILLIAAAALAITRWSGKQDKPADSAQVRPTANVGIAPQVAPNRTPTAPTTAQRTPQPTKIIAAVQASATPVPTLVPPTATTEPTHTVPTPLPSATPTESGPPTLTPTLFETATLVPTNTPQPVVVPQTTPRPAPIRDVLAVLDNLPAEARPWPDGTLARGEDGSWLLSVAGGVSNTLSIELSPQVLSALFQPGAANMLISANVVFELVNYDAGALTSGQVAFGLGAQNTDGQLTIGEVRFDDPTLVSLGKSQNGQFRALTQVPLQKQQIELAIRRANATTLSFFIDGKSLGDSVFLFSQGQPVTLVLFASGKDVVVRVNAFQIDFSPRDELP